MQNLCLFFSVSKSKQNKLKWRRNSLKITSSCHFSEDLRVLTIKHNKEKDEVKKNLTIKREKKKESVQRKLLEQERAATAALVEKHSQEMMLLIHEKRAQYVENGTDEPNGEFQTTSEYPSNPPPPMPPSFAKVEIYK